MYSDYSRLGLYPKVQISPLSYDSVINLVDVDFELLKRLVFRLPFHAFRILLINRLHVRSQYYSWTFGTFDIVLHYYSFGLTFLRQGVVC